MAWSSPMGFITPSSLRVFEKQAQAVFEPIDSLAKPVFEFVTHGGCCSRTVFGCSRLRNSGLGLVI